MKQSIATDSSSEASLTLKREFNAPIEAVFSAWTDPDYLSQWFGPEGFTVSHAFLDVSVGGKYEIALRAPDGGDIYHFGEYVQIDKPDLLVFTWELSNQDCQGSKGQNTSTLVTIHLQSSVNGTLLQLTHEKLPDQAARDGHQYGWLSSLEKLALQLNS